MSTTHSHPVPSSSAIGGEPGLHELEIAREIQNRLLPGRLRQIRGIDYYGESRPAAEVGGDFFDFIASTGESLVVSVGDVCGTGVGAAIMMAGLQAYLRVLTLERRADLTAIVQELNRIACDLSPDNFYVTLFYASIDPAHRQIRYVSAGHEPALLIREHGVARLESTGTVLGLSKRSLFRLKTAAFEPGDVLVAFTDGLTDAMSTEDRELHEMSVPDLVRRRSALSAGELVTAILESSERFASPAWPLDDRTVVVVRREKTAERVTLEDCFAELACAAT